MRKFVQALTATSLFVMTVTTASTPEFSAKDLARDEGKFAAFSVKDGMRAAFLEFFADQSWLLRPGLVDAKAWLQAQTDPPIVLDWKSQRTILSASGDLGFSTGPWIRPSKSTPNAPAAHGQFFSVWQKQKSVEWKVLIDHCISHDPPATPDALPATPLVALNLTALKRDAPVYDAEKDFVHHANKVPSRFSYIDRVTDHTVLLRDGQFPIVGKAAVMAYVNAQAGQWEWTPTLQGAPSTNDFAYVVGNVDGKTQKGEPHRGRTYASGYEMLAAKHLHAGRLRRKS
ncbi:MAG: hypothetical protein LH481_01980 [Burkholderiales bacterium]|nr:hypothetical protein [Burkholderiales bacterium]